MSDPIYRVRDLRLSFPDLTHKPMFGPAPRVEIIKGVSFEVLPGETIGIVGGSGSGKSTLGRSMVRLLEPQQGIIEFKGYDITHMAAKHLRPLRRKFQMIFQDPMSSLNPRLTVGTIIAAPMKLYGLDRVQTRTLEALDNVGLPRDFARRYPHELSGGQRQRVGIARAIALKPDFILADEIVSGLDVSSQAQVLNVLETLVKEFGLSLAFISHDLSVIRRLCRRVIVMHAGEIVENNTVEKIFDAPQSDYTRTLLDAIPLPDPSQDWF